LSPTKVIYIKEIVLDQDVIILSGRYYPEAKCADLDSSDISISFDSF